MIILQKLVTRLITEDKYQIYTKYTVVLTVLKKMESSYNHSRTIQKLVACSGILKDSKNKGTYSQFGLIKHHDNYRQGFVLTAKAVRLYIRARV